MRELFYRSNILIKTVAETGVHRDLIVRASGGLQKSHFFSPYGIYDGTVPIGYIFPDVFHSQDIAYFQPSGILNGIIEPPLVLGIAFPGEQISNELSEAITFAIAIFGRRFGIDAVNTPPAAIPSGKKTKMMHLFRGFGPAGAFQTAVKILFRIALRCPVPILKQIIGIDDTIKIFRGIDSLKTVVFKGKFICRETGKRK
ncbi:MAG: hypothetical protein E7325_01250 [Clostridiales bacterium]|nr:hypothetical protein [Clostridiales bacterium]